MRKATAEIDVDDHARNGVIGRGCRTLRGAESANAEGVDTFLLVPVASGVGRRSGA